MAVRSSHSITGLTLIAGASSPPQIDRVIEPFLSHPVKQLQKVFPCLVACPDCGSFWTVVAQRFPARSSPARNCLSNLSNLTDYVEIQVGKCQILRACYS